MTGSAAEIGYVLKGFGRTSETFITNEIALLERRGLRLRIFSLLELTGQQRHAAVDAIRAPISRLVWRSRIDSMLFAESVSETSRAGSARLSAA